MRAILKTNKGEVMTALSNFSNECGLDYIYTERYFESTLHSMRLGARNDLFSLLGRIAFLPEDNAENNKNFSELLKEVERMKAEFLYAFIDKDTSDVYLALRIKSEFVFLFQGDKDSFIDGCIFMSPLEMDEWKEIK